MSIQANPTKSAGKENRMLEKHSLLRAFLLAGALLVMASAAQATLYDGLKDYWTFDESSGTTAADSVGGKNGTITGGTGGSFYSQPGKIGTAFRFNATAVKDYVEVGSVGIGGNVARSIAGWAKADTATMPDWTGIFGFVPPGGGNYTFFDIEAVNHGASGGQGYGVHLYAAETNMIVPRDTAWHYYVASYDGAGTLAWYRDGGTLGGGAQGTLTGLTLNTTDNFRMARRQDQGAAPGNLWPGTVDEVGLWNRVLTPAEANQLYNGGAGFRPLYVAGQTLTWDGSTNNWNIAPGSQRWTGGTSPGTDYPKIVGFTADKAIVNLGGTCTVSGDEGAYSLDLGGASTVAIAPGKSLTLLTTVTTTGTGALSIGDGGKLVAQGGGSLLGVGISGTATIDNGGSLSVASLSDGGSAATFVKNGAGTLSLGTVSAVAGSRFKVNAGTLSAQAPSPLGLADQLILNGGTFKVSGVTADVAGLLEGSFIGDYNNPGNPAVNPGTSTWPGYGGAQAGTRVAQIRSDNQGNGLAPWGANIQWIYTGQIKVPASGSFAFTTGVDDTSWLKIAQNPGDPLPATWNIINGGWNNNAAVTRTPGAWLAFEARFGSSGGGGAGPNGSYGWDNTMGFGYNDGSTYALNDTLEAHLVRPSDPGDMSLFRYRQTGAIDMSATDVSVTDNSGLQASTDLQATFRNLTINDGKTLTTSGGKMVFNSITAGSGGGGRTIAMNVSNVVTTPLYTDGGVDTNFVLNGTGSLTLQSVTAKATSTFRVNGGTLTGQDGSQLGGATSLLLGGGTYEALSTTGSAALSLTALNVSTIASTSSGLKATTSSTATFSNLTLGANSTLTLSGGKILFPTTSFGAGSTLVSGGNGASLGITTTNGNANVGGAGTVNTATYKDQGIANSTMRIYGGVTLALDNTVPGNVVANNTNFRVEGGTLDATGAAPLGAGNTLVTLAGGTFRATPVPGGSALSMPTTTLSVVANSSLYSNTTNTGTFNLLRFDAQSTLTVGSAGGDVRFTNTTTTVAGIVGLTTNARTNIGVVNGAGLVTTFVKTGTADLIINQAGTNLQNTTFEARGGRLDVIGNIIPAAKLNINGGELFLTSADGKDVTFSNVITSTGNGTLSAGGAVAGYGGSATGRVILPNFQLGRGTTVTMKRLTTPCAIILPNGVYSPPQEVSNVIAHYGYHINNDGVVMDLNNNGGMWNKTSPTTFSNYFGKELLSTGPGGRGLDFNDDNDFINSGAIGQVDNYSNLFIGTLHVDAARAGNWIFRINVQDDPTGIWVDLNRNGIFESSTAGLGSDRGEQLLWNATDQRTVNLVAGNYLVAFTHREGGGGSQIEAMFQAPGMSALTMVKPADPAQAGLWSSFQPGGGLDIAQGVTMTYGPLTLGSLTLSGGDLIRNGTSPATSGSRDITVYDFLTLSGGKNLAMTQGAKLTTTGATININAGSTLWVDQPVNAANLNILGNLVRLPLGAGDITVTKSLTVGSTLDMTPGGALNTAGANITVNSTGTLIAAAPLVAAAVTTSGALTMPGGTLASLAVTGGTTTLTGPLTLTNSLSGSGGTLLTKGNFTIDPQTALSYTGKLNVASGNLTLNAPAGGSPTAGDVQLSPGTSISFGGAGTPTVNSATAVGGPGVTGPMTVLAGATRQFSANGSAVPPVPPDTLTLDAPLSASNFALTGSGTVALRQGLTMTAGSLSVPAGTTLSTQGTQTINASAASLVMQGTLNVASGTLTFTVPGSSGPAGTPVAYYSFNNSGAVGTDNTGNGHNATTVSNATWTSSGVVGGALNFAGNGYVEIPYSAAFGLNSYTVSSWVNLNNEPGAYGVFGTRFGAEQTFDFKIQGGNIHGDVGSGPAGSWLNTNVDANVDVPLSQWHMVTYAIDNAAQNARIYYDGVQSAGPLGFTGIPLLMAASQTMRWANSSGGEYMNGLLDEALVYGRAISAAEVLALYQAGLGGAYATAAALGNLTMASGTQLNLTGSGVASFSSIRTFGPATIQGAVTATGPVTLGASPDTLSVTGSFKMGAGSTYNWETQGAGLGNSDLIAVTGNLDLTGPWTLAIAPLKAVLGGTYDLFTYTGSLNPATPSATLARGTTAYADLVNLAGSSITTSAGKVSLSLAMNPFSQWTSNSGSGGTVAWNLASNWDSGVPSASTAAIVQAPGANQVATVSGPGAAAQTLIIDNGGQVLVQSAGALQVTNNAYVEPTGSLTVNGTFGAAQLNTAGTTTFGPVAILSVPKINVTGGTTTGLGTPLGPTTTLTLTGGLLAGSFESTNPSKAPGSYAFEIQGGTANAALRGNTASLRRSGSSSSAATLNGPITLDTMSVEAGTTTINDNETLRLNTLNVSAGSLTVNRPSQIGTANLSGGTTTSTRNMTVTKSFQGGGTFVADGAQVLDLSSSGAAFSGEIRVVSSIPANSPSLTVNVPPPGTTPPQLLTGLIAYWPFNEGTGTTTADLSGRGNPGTINAGTTWANDLTRGVVLNFPAAGSVTIPPAALSPLANGSQVTLSFWAYGVGQPRNNVNFYGVDASGNRVLNAHTPWGDSSVYWDAGNSGGGAYDRINRAGTAADWGASWANWVFVKDATAGTLQIYRNGTLWHSGTGLTRTLSPITSFRIGADTGGGNAYNGMMDDFAVWSRAMPAADVQTLFAAGGLGAGPARLGNLRLGATGSFTLGGSGTASFDSMGAIGGVTVSGSGLTLAPTPPVNANPNVRSENAQSLTIKGTLTAASFNVTGGPGTVTLTDKLAVTAGGMLTVPKGVTLASRGSNVVIDAPSASFNISGKLNVASGTLTINLPAATASMPSGLVLRLDGSNITGVGNLGKVNSWPDSSGQSHPADQATGNPLYVASGLNGQPVVRFVASDGADYLSTTYDFDGIGNQYTILSVERYTGGANQRIVSSVNHNWLFGHWNGHDECWYAEGWITAQNGDANTNWHLYAGTINSANQATFWKDSGTPLYTNSTGGNAGNHNPGRLQLGNGGVGSSGSEFSNAELAQVLIFNRVLSNTEINNVGGYLSSRYGLTTGFSGSLGATNLGDLQMAPATRLILGGPSGPGTGGASFTSIASGPGAEIDGNVTASGLLDPTGTLTIKKDPATGLGGNLDLGPSAVYKFDLATDVKDLIALDSLAIDKIFTLQLYGAGANVGQDDWLKIFDFNPHTGLTIGGVAWDGTDASLNLAALIQVANFDDPYHQYVWDTCDATLVHDDQGIYLTGLLAELIPEPASLLLLGMGAFALLRRRRGAKTA